MKSYITSEIEHCPRCGLQHGAVVFEKLRRRADEYTHWTMCPETLEPVFLAEKIVVGEEPINAGAGQ